MKAKILNLARAAKNDEFYTQLPDIERELSHYEKHFRGKVVYCNCDDPRVSNFFHYFKRNFERLQLKKLIAACYKNQNPNLFSSHDCEKAVYLEFNGSKSDIKEFNGDGDFRSEESIALLKQADVVATNPPFSLFREYVKQLVKYDKKFVIMGPMHCISNNDIFPLLQRNTMWLGVPPHREIWFDIPDKHAEKAFPIKKKGSAYKIIDGVVKIKVNVVWFTNLEHGQSREYLVLHKTYTKDEYPKYDNYDAINVNRIQDLPVDYAGAMGVPVSFMDKFNPDQFEIIKVIKPADCDDGKNLSINGKLIYARILIRRVKNRRKRQNPPKPASPDAPGAPISHRVRVRAG